MRLLFKRTMTVLPINLFKSLIIGKFGFLSYVENIFFGNFVAFF